MTSFKEKYSELYDLFYEEKKYNDETTYILRLLDEKKISGKNIIDFGCGTGSYTFELQKKGYNVTGYDISPTMVKLAEDRAKKNNVSIPFKVADLRTPESISGSVDVLVSLFHVFNYLQNYEELDMAFKTCRKLIKEKGVLIFDCWHGAALLRDIPIQRVKKIKTAQQEIIRTTTPVIDYANCLVDVNFDVICINIESKITEAFNEEHKMRYWFMPELTYFAKKNGFKTVEFKKWMKDDVPDDKSWYISVVCQ
jgi:2-polyprenyl-3-methyl-5-hydroxy-6-metoxy-1,4-benzoquinol methylase